MNMAKGAGGPKGGPPSQSNPKGDGLPVRPQLASKPNPITLLANYFNLTLGKDDLTVYKYTFKVKGSKNQELRGATAKNIFESALTGLKVRPDRYATDFQHQIVSLDILTAPDNKESNGFSIDFEPVLPLQLSKSVLSSPSSDVIDCLNLITGQWARTQTEIAAIGRHRFFFPNISENCFKTDTAESLSVVRGFFQGVRPAEAKLFLNVNSTIGVFRPVGNIGALYNNLANKHRDLAQLHGVISKARVIYSNPGDKKPPRTVNIAGFARKDDSVSDKPSKDKTKGEKGSWIAKDFPSPSEVRFWCTEGQTGEYRTVLEHYERKYGRLAHNARTFPLVNIGTPSRPQHVPSPFCELEWGQPLRRKVTDIPDLSHKKLAELNNFTCRNPNYSKKWIDSAHQSKYLNLDAGLDNKVLKNFGVSIGKELLKVKGRILESPEIEYSNGNSKVKGGSWFSKRLLEAVPLKKWTWKYLGKDSTIPVLVSDGMHKFRQRLRDRCGQSSNPISIPADIEKELSQGLSQGVKPVNNLLEWARGNVDLIVLVFETRVTADVYNAVKFLGDIRHGVHTCCILQDKFMRDHREKGLIWDDTYFDNVALKINLKMGGRNHALVLKGSSLFREPGLIVAGYDVTHPTGDANTGDNSESTESNTEAGVKGPHDAAKQPQPQNQDCASNGRKKEQSQGGLVVSANSKFGQWLPYYWNQAPRKEMTKTTIKEAFADRFKAWKLTNQSQQLLKVVIYRDGVSESQFGQVLEQEVPEIRAAYSAVFPNSKPPQFTLVVAVKRHATRFFPEGGQGRDSKGNILPGMVVDNGVTQPKYWEFFLAAHAAIVGTTRPTRYVVILDEIFKNKYTQSGAADELEKFTHEMSYIFGRATKAVGVCTPAYYADILCTRARAYMSALANDRTLSVIQDSIAQLNDGEKGRVLAGKIHPDLKNSMYWI